MNITEKLEKIYPRVLKPTRYLGNELNSIRKNWDEVKTKIALCFPDTYEIGMSHLGLKILYHYLNEKKEWLAERCYMPWTDMTALLREENIPLTSLENKRPLSEFDIVGFSLQYEMEYTNVPEMLSLGGIPVRSSDRGEDCPVVIAGGPVVFNPEPMALFMDAFLIGDGEEAFAEVIQTVERQKSIGANREEILTAIAKIRGVYVPRFYSEEYDKKSGKVIVKKPERNDIPFPVPREVLRDINRFPFPSDIIVPYGKIVHDRIAVELSRGCTQGCRFCQAGIIYRPVREREPLSLQKTITETIKKTGYNEVSLTSLSSADYTGIELLAEYLMDVLEEKDTSLAISSMRVYGLTDKLAKEISRVKKTGFTIAPEAGSQRLRDVINKGISESDIMNGGETAFSNGWQLIKLYFMIGLPTETDEDVAEIARIALDLLKIGRKHIGNRAKLNISVNTFIPKPHTPFQWSALTPEEVIRKRKKLLLELIKHEKNISVSFNDYRLSVVETVLSRGDRQVGKAVERAWKKGAVLDAWNEYFDYERWLEAFKESGVDINAFTGAFHTEETLPWDHIDSLVKKEFLAGEYAKALKEKITLPCEQPVLRDPRERTVKIKSGAKNVCYDCGLECGLPAISSERKTNIETLEKEIEKFRKKASGMARQDINPQDWPHYLVTYEKSGEMRFLSQLDFQKLLVHAFRRAAIPVAISLGYSPRPKIWFPVSLGVGISGRKERLGFSALYPIDEEKALRELNSFLPEGLIFHSIVRISGEELKKYKKIKRMAYRFYYPRGKNLENEISAKVREFLAADEIFIEREVKKKKKRIEIRSLIESVTHKDQSSVLEVVCKVEEGAGARPENLAELFLGLPLEEVEVERLWVE